MRNWVSGKKLCFSADDSSQTSDADSVAGAENDSADIPSWIRVGENVLVRPNSLPGVVSYVGRTHFANGIWVGVALTAPMGLFYFDCRIHKQLIKVELFQVKMMDLSVKNDTLRASRNTACLYHVRN